MQLKKKDFIEVEFTGKVKDGEIFDSNIKKDLEKIGSKLEAKPFIFCLDESMFLSGIDDFLIGKDIGKYQIELEPEKAFGNRNSKLVQIMPMKIFQEHKVNPVQGAMFNFDGRVAKILSVSGGRVIVDFNNPLSGKIVVYNLNVLRKIDDLNEKIKSFNEFLFKRDFKFEAKDKKLTINVDKGFKQFVEMFKDKFKDIFDLELEVIEIGEEYKQEKEEEEIESGTK